VAVFYAVTWTAEAMVFWFAAAVGAGAVFGVLGFGVRWLISTVNGRWRRRWSRSRGGDRTRTPSAPSRSTMR
jgi:hypothetical protein